MYLLITVLTTAYRWHLYAVHDVTVAITFLYIDKSVS